MNIKVELIYENDEYKIVSGGEVVATYKDVDDAIIQFKQSVAKSKVPDLNSWGTIEKELEKYKEFGLEINSEYKNMTFGELKYFNPTGKVFSFVNGEMMPLMGGYQFFKFIISLAAECGMESYREVLDLCKIVVNKNAIYRIKDTSIVVSSPRFNYGACEYNFNSRKIHKGASVTEGDFAEFKEYIASILG